MESFANASNDDLVLFVVFYVYVLLWLPSNYRFCLAHDGFALL